MKAEDVDLTVDALHKKISEHREAINKYKTEANTLRPQLDIIMRIIKTLENEVLIYSDAIAFLLKNAVDKEEDPHETY